MSSGKYNFKYAKAKKLHKEQKTSCLSNAAINVTHSWSMSRAQRISFLGLLLATFPLHKFRNPPSSTTVHNIYLPPKTSRTEAKQCIMYRQQKDAPCLLAVLNQYLSSSKSGHIKNDISSKIFACVSHSISQYQSTFCISVIDFHGSRKKRGHLIQQCFRLEVNSSVWTRTLDEKADSNLMCFPIWLRKSGWLLISQLQASRQSTHGKWF